MVIGAWRRIDARCGRSDGGESGRGDRLRSHQFPVIGPHIKYLLQVLQRLQGHLILPVFRLLCRRHDWDCVNEHGLKGAGVKIFEYYCRFVLWFGKLPSNADHGPHPFLNNPSRNLAGAGGEVPEARRPGAGRQLCRLKCTICYFAATARGSAVCHPPTTHPVTS